MERIKTGKEQKQHREEAYEQRREIMKDHKKDF